MRLSPKRDVLVLLSALITIVVAATAHGQTKIPETLQKAGQLHVGVKCDSPPFGYLDQQGKPGGVDVDFARHIASKAFNDPAKAIFTCVNSANRVQMLVSGKVDLLLATMGATEERKKTVDFATGTNWDGSVILVRSDSNIRTLDDLNGKTVFVTKGALNAIFFERNYPKINLVKLDSINDIIQALRQGRGDAASQDVAPMTLAAERDSSLRLVPNLLFAISWGAPAVRRGDDELRLFLNEMVQQAQQDGTFEATIRKHTTGAMRDLILAGYLTPAPDGSRAEQIPLKSHP